MRPTDPAGGMDLRTYIAANALPALISAAVSVCMVTATCGDDSTEAADIIKRALDKTEIARDTVAFADALIAELAKEANV